MTKVCLSVHAVFTHPGLAGQRGRYRLFIQVLIDDYITPLAQTDTPDFGPLLQILLVMLCVFMTGVLSTFAYNRILVYIGQGTLRNVRDDLFAHMERLPISYFDTHAHGDIMSIYTNDIDTLRQMIQPEHAPARPLRR